MVRVGEAPELCQEGQDEVSNRSDEGFAMAEASRLVRKEDTPATLYARTIYVPPAFQDGRPSGLRVRLWKEMMVPFA